MATLASVATSPNAYLTNLSSFTRNKKYVAQEILTPVRTDREQGYILKEDSLSLFQQIRHLTNGSSRAGEIDIEVSSDSFALDSFSLKSYVPVQEIWSSAVGPLEPRMRRVRKLTNAIELLMEIISAAAIFDAAVGWTSANKTTIGGVGTRWDQAGADPIKDILAAKNKIMCQDPDNQIVALFGETAFNAYRTAALVRASFQAAGGGGAAANTGDLDANAWAQQQVAAQIGVSKVVVGSAKADDGTGTRVDIWGDNVLLAVVNNGEMVDSEAFGHTLWFGDTIRRVYEWFDQDKGTDGSYVEKCSTTFFPKGFLNPLGGHLIVDVAT